MSAYLNYGDMDSYNALVEKRASAGTASEEEYSGQPAAQGSSGYSGQPVRYRVNV